MDNTAINILFGCSILMLLCAFLLIWAAKRMENRHDRNAEMLVGLIFQQTDGLSDQLHNLSKKSDDTRLGLTQQIQFMARANAPNLPSAGEVEHRKIMKVVQPTEGLQKAYQKKFAA